MFKPFYVHINPYACGKLPSGAKFRGATVKVSPNDETTVYVQTTMCSKRDPFCKKEGRSYAEKATEVVMNKRRVPAYIGELEAKVWDSADGAYLANQHMHLLKNFI